MRSASPRPGAGLVAWASSPSDSSTVEASRKTAADGPRQPAPQSPRQEAVEARPGGTGGRPAIPPQPPAASASGAPTLTATIQPAPQPRTSYNETVRGLDGRASGVRVGTVTRQQRSRVLRDLVIQRSGGRCENPACPFPEFVETTTSGAPVLDVDHVQDLKLGGEDHPANMIALCPNCHAVKTRGARSDDLRQELLPVARALHAQAMSAGSPKPVA
ncbi:HNH endonuclease [Kitasatospora sp. NPDC057223]|uniref:HNH endonuclease n=1 Tax=Kitasatospora sp. NPDC057223 TaxID=3346055 RepID=UPI00362A33E7